jgi:hypothetical protein
MPESQTILFSIQLLSYQPQNMWSIMKKICIRIFFLSFFFLLLSIGLILAEKNEEYPKQFSVLPIGDSLLKSVKSYKDSSITVAAGKHYQHGTLHNIFYGKHYRDLWALPLKVQVFDIGSIHGGLKVHKKGGGYQTLSLRLTDKDKRRYVIRSIDKDPSKALPPKFQKTFVKHLFRDQTSALNPYAGLVVPKLSEYAGLFHTNPSLYFIPYDDRFGEFAKEFEGRVVLLEEYPDSSWSGTPLFNNASDIINSEHMLENFYTKQHVKIDERMLAKARLFDLWIGDWDRHIEQWKWAEYNLDKKLYYKPIARDRDMAFCKFSESGIFTFISSNINNKLQTFDYKYGNIKGMEKNARYLDHVLLKSLTKQDILGIADSLKLLLTDQAIEQAISLWPDQVYQRIGPEIIAKLKYRRDHLTEIAEEFYELISEEVVVTGTDMIETVEVVRIDDKQTSVKVLNENSEIMYFRIFRNDETKIIKIYALKGNDQISLSGTVRNGIDIELYGGEGNDLITDHSHVKGTSNKTRIYDSKEGNRIEFGKESEDKTSDDPCILDFDRIGIRVRKQ